MKYLGLLAIILLTACSSQPPKSATYLLRSDVSIENRERVANPTVAIAKLQVAEYIDQPGLVLETETGNIHSARHHRWAEPLRVSMRQFLASEIGQHIGSDVAIQGSSNPGQTRVDIRIDQFHGTPRGSAVLVAYWNIINSEQQSSHQFSRQETLTRDGYDGLVEAQKALLVQLGTAIADSIPTGS